MSHGGDIYNMGLDVREVLDFSASVNPLALPSGLRSVVRECMADMGRYPDPRSSRLTRAASEAYGVDERRIVCANGSTELIYLLPRALKPRKVLIPSPTYSDYERASKLVGARIVRFPLRKPDNFLPDTGRMSRAMEGADMAFLANPGNPFGLALGREGMMELLSGAKRAGCLLVVDEAFIEFCPDHSVIGAESPNLVVLRSLTKFYALAGIRAGFGVFPPRVAHRIWAYKEPWSVNVLAERLGAECVKLPSFAERTRRFMKAEKLYMEGRLAALGIKFYPSHANYYLLETGHAVALREGLLKKGIVVRDCSDFRGLGRRHIRVAVRSRAENMRLLDEMSRILKGGTL